MDTSKKKLSLLSLFTRRRFPLVYPCSPLLCGDGYCKGMGKRGTLYLGLKNIREKMGLCCHFLPMVPNHGRLYYDDLLYCRGAFLCPKLAGS